VALRALFLNFSFGFHIVTFDAPPLKASLALMAVGVLCDAVVGTSLSFLWFPKLVLGGVAFFFSVGCYVLIPYLFSSLLVRESLCHVP